jgi:AraC family transcriptional regulator, regulatory protein of adaptative response / DNA-3-methyladenine glycosylase II
MIEQLVAAVYSAPARYPDVAALGAAAGVEQATLVELFLLHYHTTPADMLARLRSAAARSALLESSASMTAIASDVGFESVSTFHQQFRKYTAMSPGDYRQMREAPTFTVALPKVYLAQRMLGYLGRDRDSLTDRVEGATWTSAVRLGAAAGVLVRVTIRPRLAQCEVLAPTQLDTAGMERVHTHVVSGLGLSYDPCRFEAQLAKSPELAPLIQGQRGLHIPLISDHFDGLVWAIIGQQISLSFAYTLRRRLIERVSQEIAAGWFVPPAPHAVAELAEDELVGLQFSRAKAAYLIGAAQAVLDGRLPLAQLVGRSVTQIERLLLALRGIGPWSANYVLMRSYGFLDCVPVGDAGLTRSLQRFFKLEQRPDKRTTLTLMEAFRPYRSLATFHLWQRLGTPG